MSVIMWTISAGLVIFGVGLTSAIGSRRRKNTPQRTVPVSIDTGTVRSSAMNEAAAEACKDLLVLPVDMNWPQAVLEAFHRGESMAFTRIRETIETAFWAVPDNSNESTPELMRRVLDEVARRLGIKP